MPQLQLQDASIRQAVGAAAVPIDDRPRPAATWLAVKRALDLVGGLLILVALPVLGLAIAAAIRLDSPGPVLFRQERLGRGGRRFTVLKFRTMRHGASADAHRAYIARAAGTGTGDDGLNKLTRDPRVTRVGAFLRRTSLDELPQVLNIVTGHMSLVGPRPALAYELEHYAGGDFDRFAVRPGMTGLWQVSGRSELSFREMLTLDAEYARTHGPAVDARIMLRTPLAVAQRRAS